MVVFPVHLSNVERAFVQALHFILARLYQRHFQPNRNVPRSCFNLILASYHPLDKQASLLFSTENFFSHNGDADLWNEIPCSPDHHPICHIRYSKCLCLPFLLFPADTNPCTNKHHEGSFSALVSQFPERKTKRWNKRHLMLTFISLHFYILFIKMGNNIGYLMLLATREFY